MIHVVLARNDVGVRNFTNPDVTELGRVVVVLNLKGFAISVRLILRSSMVERIAFNRPMILNDATIKKNSNIGGTDDFCDIIVAVGVFFRAKNRTSEDDVVGLPFGGFFNTVNIRRELFVDGTALTFKVGRILVRIENLKFIVIHEENTAITTTLTFSIGIVNRRTSEFKMKLATTKLFLCNDRTGTRLAGQNAVGNGPVASCPFVKICSIEKNDRIRGRVFWSFTGSDDRRFRPINSHTEVAALEFMILGVGNASERRDA